MADADWTPVSVRVSPNGDVHVPTLLAAAFSISTSEARRCIAQGAVKVRGAQIRVADWPAASLDGEVVTLGARRAVRLELESRLRFRPAD